MKQWKIFIILILSIIIIAIFVSLKYTTSRIDDVQTISVNTPATLPIIDTVISPAIFPIASTTPVDVITAKSFLVGDLESGEILQEYNSSTSLPIASISKLMNALVTVNFSSTTAYVTITKDEMNVPGDSSGITAGETYTIYELLSPLLLNSSNIAAEVLASSSARGNFIYTMSSYAQEIGMTDSYFDDPSGLSSLNRANAKDLFTLASYLYKYRPDILAMTRAQKVSIATTTEHGSHVFMSTHPFINDPRFVGGKTGRTSAAGETMLTILNIEGRPVVFIILGSDIGVREHDTKLLIEAYAAHLD
ncbi:MAG: serine hydrolase [Candidatus Taylorbacteria bacterium]